MKKSQKIQSKRGSSETLRNESCLDYTWLAGLIDADGGFYVSRNRYVSCEITMHENEIQTLYFIKKHLGGSVKPRKGKRAYRWRLHKREPIVDLLNQVNSCLQTKRVQDKFVKACQLYDISIIPTKPLNLETGWFSGFFSGDGSFSINVATQFQPSLSISQTEQNILQRIAAVVGGEVYYDKSWNGWIWWVDVRSVPEILDYFQRFSLQNPLKQARLKSIQRFLGYLERGLHLDPASQDRLHHFVRLFQKSQQD